MHPVEHPTYMADIRFMFEEQDMNCMISRGIDLRTYKGVKFDATRIYFNVREGSMPPPHQDRRWSEEKVETFYNWMRDGYPRGIALQNRELPVTASGANRMRRNLADYEEGSEELELLRKAFRGIMNLDTEEPDNPNSYFNVASIHWFPQPLYCRHHENAYNPWHRAYLLQFENALRSIDGCEDVTLPYWDITADSIPEVLFHEPFAEYEFKNRVDRPNGTAIAMPGDKTSRFDANEILGWLQFGDVRGDIRDALAASRWEDFNGWRGNEPWVTTPTGGMFPDHQAIIRAHDTGHGACGPTLSSPNLASFDPLFWFFHCNWDRLWWRWQQLYDGKTLADFKTLLDGDAYWLTDPVVNGLDPFGEEASNMINSVALGVDYVHPSEEEIPEVSPPLVASANSGGTARIVDTSRMLVAIGPIERLNIPGSFSIVLKADGRPIRQRGLFQSTEPKLCDTCRKQSTFVTKFDVSRDEIDGRNLSASIELIGPSGKPSMFPLSSAGDPRISVHVKMTA